MAVLAASGCTSSSRQSTPLGSADSVGLAQRPIVVSTATALVAALISARPGTTVLLQPGAYELAKTLMLPDSVTLLGSGVMKLDSLGRLPVGFDPRTRTVLKSAGDLQGDVLVLGNRSAARGLAIEDAAGRSSGNIVVVHSRGAGDVVSATLEDCEILNPNHQSDAREGPTGTSVAAVTAAPGSAASADSSARLGATVALRMSHCIVHSPLGSGLFITNFAPRGRINVLLTENVIGGTVTASGGESRSFAVSGASTEVESRGNVFRADSVTPPAMPGWLICALTSLHVPGVPAYAAANDTFHVRSTGDRIDGFQTAIMASGALRLSADADALSGNVATLELHQTEIRSVKTDLDLAGARSVVAGTFADSGNVLRLIASGMAGSGQRESAYLATSGPPGTSWLAGNRIEVIGSTTVFARANHRIALPRRELFRVAR